MFTALWTNWAAFWFRVYNRRFMTLKWLQYIPADTHFNISSHYVSPSILRLWLRRERHHGFTSLRYTSRRSPRQIYEPGCQSFISCQIDVYWERERGGKRKRKERKRKWHILVTWRHVGTAPGPQPDAVWVTRGQAGSAGGDRSLLFTCFSHYHVSTPLWVRIKET